MAHNSKPKGTGAARKQTIDISFYAPIYVEKAIAI